MAKEPVSPDEKKTLSVSRRSLLRGAAIIPVSTLTLPAIAGAETKKATAAVASPVFSKPQRRILDALVDTLIPHDELGPGALESGVADYIETYMGDFGAGEKTGF